MFMPRPVALLIDKLARQSVGKDWGVYAGLLDHWAEIVGIDYAAVTTPVKIGFPLQTKEARRGKGTLCIRLPKGLAMEFAFKTEIIRQRINGYFGHEAVARIVLEPVHAMPPTRPPLQEISPQELEELRSVVTPVEDMALREALLSFGEAILRGRERSAPTGNHPAIK